MWWYVKEQARMLAALVAVFVAGALLGSVGGFLALALFAVFIVPRWWRASVEFNAQREDERRRRNIATQMLTGAYDARLIREVAEDMKRDGRL